jgi:peptide/nickel transport system substrate-binding protein
MKRRKPAIDVVTDNVGEPLTEHDRETLADLVDDYRGSTISRRSFVGRAAVFGLSAASLTGLLAESATARSRTVGATPKKTAKLAIGVGQDMDTIDPQAFKDIPGYYMIGNIYDQLIDLRAHPINKGDILLADPSRPTAMIARSMRISKDRLTATFKLDPRAKFQDGTPITVDDVKYTFTRGILGTQYTNTLMKMLTLTKPTNILTPDRQTVVFKLDKPNPMTERLLSLQVLSIQSAQVSKAHTTKKDKWADAYWRSNSFGNSAYSLKSWTRGQGWELAPSANFYRGGLPRNGGLIFKVVADPQERLNLLQSGTLHVAFEVSAKDAAALRAGRSKNAKLVNTPSPWNFMLVFTNSVKPLDNKLVRQALSYAVPYQAIIKNVMYGLARPSRGPIVPGMPTSDPSFWHYNTDLAKAKQLLAQANLPNGFDTSIDVLIGRPEDEQAATLIQANFQQIGVKASINKLDASQYQDNRNNAKSPMQIAEWFSWVNDPMYHLYWNFLSSNTFTNSARYANKAVDRLIQNGMYEPNQARRATMSRQAQRMIVDDAPWAFLFARDFFQPVARNLHDFPLWPDQNPRFYWTFLT